MIWNWHINELAPSSPQLEIPLKHQSACSYSMVSTLSVHWGNEMSTQMLLKDFLYSLWALYKIHHINVIYTYGDSNERCYHLWRNKRGCKWTLALWYMTPFQPGEIYQVSSIKKIIILWALLNSSQPFNSVFSQLILIILLWSLEFPLSNLCSAHCCRNICLVFHSLAFFSNRSWYDFLINVTAENQTVV